MLFPGKESSNPASASSTELNGMPAMNGTGPGLGSAAHTFAPAHQPQPQRPASGSRQRSASEPVGSSRFAAEAATGQTPGSGSENPSPAHRPPGRAAGSTQDSAAAGTSGDEAQQAGHAAVASASHADAAASRSPSAAGAAAAGQPATSPFAAPKQQQKGPRPSVADTHAGSGGQRSSKAWRQLMQATLREQLHQRQQMLQRVGFQDALLRFWFAATLRSPPSAMEYSLCQWLQCKKTQATRQQ